MKKYLKMTRDGFTLVELMVVVAIIGILASIAIPQYSKFQAKARQSEVRIQLGATYTVEQSFAAENSTYTMCLGQVGYNRDGTKFYYTVGFVGVAADSGTCMPGNAAAGSCYTYQWSYTPIAGGGGGNYNPASVCATNPSTEYFLANIAEPGQAITTQAMLVTGTGSGKINATTTATSTAFTIGAAGNILGSAKNTDGWTIDNNKQILNTQSGLN